MKPSTLLKIYGDYLRARSVKENVSKDEALATAVWAIGKCRTKKEAWKKLNDMEETTTPYPY